MRETGSPQRNNFSESTPDESENIALYRTITKHSAASLGPGKGHNQEETEPAEMAEDETEVIDALDFEKKISTMTSLDRDAALRLASDLIIRLHRRTCTERFRERDGDRTRVAYARALVSALQTYGVLLKDDEIEQLKQRVDALERIKGDGKP